MSSEYDTVDVGVRSAAGVVGIIIISFFLVGCCPAVETKHTLEARIYQCYTKAYDDIPYGYNCNKLWKQEDNCTIDLLEGRGQSPECRTLFSLINKISKGDYTPYESNEGASVVQLEKPKVNNRGSSEEGGGLEGHVATTVGAYHGNGGAHNPSNQYGNIGWNPYAGGFR